MAKRDYYEILGVSRNATDKEIKSAYRKLARKFHPDVNPGDKAAEEKFKDISEAYEVLMNKDSRNAYDQFGPQWQQAQRAGAASAGGFDGTNFDFDFGQGDGGGMGGGFGSIFETLFGSGAQVGHGRRIDFGDFTPPRQDVQATVEITLEEAASGTERQVNVDGRRLTVKIPAGVATGSKVRLPGQASAKSQRPGDVYLNVTVRPHPVFTREGDNLIADVQVPYPIAALGGEVSVPTLTGRVTMKIPAGVQSGQSLRLQGKGMPSLKGGKGDLLARVMITVPREVTARERDLLREIAAAKNLKTGTR